MFIKEAERMGIPHVSWERPGINSESTTPNDASDWPSHRSLRRPWRAPISNDHPYLPDSRNLVTRSKTDQLPSKSADADKTHPVQETAGLGSLAAILVFAVDLALSWVAISAESGGRKGHHRRLHARAWAKIE
jgi:hypothetical protein